MNKAQIRRFLEHWCQAVEDARTPELSIRERTYIARREIEGIMRAVQNPGVRRLALIHHTGARLAQKRIELYKLAADTQARTWRQAQGVPESALVKESALLKEDYLTPLLITLAYWLHVNMLAGLATVREVYDVLGEAWAHLNEWRWDVDNPLGGRDRSEVQLSLTIAEEKSHIRHGKEGVIFTERVGQLLRSRLGVKRQMNKLDHVWQTSLFKPLAHKHKSSVTKIANRLRTDNGYVLIVREEHKTRTTRLFRLKDWHPPHPENPYLDRLPNVYVLTLCHSELIRRLNAGQCEYCETRQGPFEVHHIRRMKDVANKEELWQRMMAARHRKTLVLCRKCHHLLHEGKLPDKAFLQAQVKGEPCTVKDVRTVRREGDG